MTVKETIAVLGEMVPQTCKMVNGRLKGGFKNWNSVQGNAIKMAIETLQKQDPQKSLTGGMCKCGCVLADYFIYCPKCGQAIDWEE